MGGKNLIVRLHKHEMSLEADMRVCDDEVVLVVKSRGRPQIKFNAHIQSIICYEVKKMAIKAGQEVKISIQPVDAFGNPAKIDGVPVWTASNELLSLLPSDDGLSVIATSTGHIGSADVSVVVDADLSVGVRQLAGNVTVEIEAGEAVSLNEVVEPIVVEIAPVVNNEAEAQAAQDAAQAAVDAAAGTTDAAGTTGEQPAE